jgi:hypothetical protein
MLVDDLSENRHEALGQPCRSDRFSLFVVAGQLGPAMLVYPKIALEDRDFRAIFMVRCGCDLYNLV